MSYYGASKTKTDNAIDAMSGGKAVEPNKAWYEEEETKRRKAEKDKDQKSYWSDTINRIFGTPRK
jgi:hypothetical protein